MLQQSQNEQASVRRNFVAMDISSLPPTSQQGIPAFSQLNQLWRCCSSLTIECCATYAIRRLRCVQMLPTPSVGCSSPIINFMKVVLPAPFLPSNAHRDCIDSLPRHVGRYGVSTTTRCTPVRTLCAS
eukprot:COSAG02_NODE_35671_length_465_cov_0.806011_1_plen_127_part_10